MRENAVIGGVIPLSEPRPAPLWRRVFSGEFARDGAIVFGSTMIVNVLNYAIHFILSRKLGVEEYGSFAALMSALAIFSIPSNIAVTIVAKFIAEFHAVQDNAKIRLLSYRVLGLGAAAGLVALIAAAILERQVADYLHLATAASVLAAAAVLALTLIAPILRAVLQGVQDFGALGASSLLEGAGKLFLGLVLVFAGFGVAGVFWGYALAIALAALATLRFVSRHWSYTSVRLRIDTGKLVNTTGAVIVSTSAITLLGYIDLPLVKHFFSPTEAGIYSAASVCGKMLFFLVGFVPTLVLPKAARRKAAGLQTVSVLWQGLLLTAGLSVLALGAFWLFAPELVRFTYGAAFSPSAEYILPYGVAMALLAATNVVVTYKIGLHRYGFVVPLIIIAIAEPVALHAFHSSLWTVIEVLIVGNAIALASCLSSGILRRRLG